MIRSSLNVHVQLYNIDNTPTWISTRRTYLGSLQELRRQGILGSKAVLYNVPGPARRSPALQVRWQSYGASSSWCGEVSGPEMVRASPDLEDGYGLLRGYHRQRGRMRPVGATVPARYTVSVSGGGSRAGREAVITGRGRCCCCCCCSDVGTMAGVFDARHITSQLAGHHTLHPTADMADLYWYDNALRLHSPSTLAVFLRFSDE